MATQLAAPNVERLWVLALLIPFSMNTINATYRFGPMLIGVLLNTMLYGVSGSVVLQFQPNDSGLGYADAG